MNLLNLVFNCMQVQIVSIGFHNGGFPSLSERRKQSPALQGSMEGGVVTCIQPEMEMS